MSLNGKRILMGAVLLLSASFAVVGVSGVSKAKTYTISPTTKLTGTYAKSKNVNSYTKHYFLLQTYMEKLEQKKGGTLVLKKGTYLLSNVVCIPSNTKLILSDGVVIRKIFKTGKADFVPAQGMFQVIEPSKRKKVKCVGKYNGAKNVSVIGKGNATIDLANIQYAKGLVTAHSQNVLIDHIKFTNMYTGHFLEVDATKNIRIAHCSFVNANKNSLYAKEAINLDTPDLITKGLNVVWTTYDKTANQDVLIENNTFTNLQRGIGTHKYSQLKVNGAWKTNSYHTGITIRNNTFSNIKNTGIFMMNWKNIKIEKNTFTNNFNALNFRGVQDAISIKNNIFKATLVTTTYGSRQLIYSKGFQTPGPGSCYSAIYNNMKYVSLDDILSENQFV